MKITLIMLTTLLVTATAFAENSDPVTSTHQETRYVSTYNPCSGEFIAGQYTVTNVLHTTYINNGRVYKNVAIGNGEAIGQNSGNVYTAQSQDHTTIINNTASPRFSFSTRQSLIFRERGPGGSYVKLDYKCKVLAIDGEIVDVDCTNAGQTCN